VIDPVLRRVLWLVERPLAVATTTVAARDVALVLGAPLTADGRISRAMHERVSAAASLWHAGAVRAIIVSGGVSRAGFQSEAEAMSSALQTVGVPQSAIVVEKTSLNTRQNAQFSALLMKQQGWQSAWIVTQPFHVKRGVYCCRRAGIDAHAWHIADSIQYQRPVTGLRWTAREYGAWAALLVRGSR
jgi:uncharacterized SAM-binding protein YcdF (DUF218 family)